MIRILFVCMGNICRSPTAQGVFMKMAKEAGLEKHVLVDSAGTGDWHVGAPPDERAQAAALKRGYDLSALRGRQVTKKDFSEFDLILAMDDENLRTLLRWCPMDQLHKVKLLTEFCSKGACPVPDPYGGGPKGFEVVLDLIEDSARGLLEYVKRHVTPA